MRALIVPAPARDLAPVRAFAEALEVARAANTLGDAAACLREEPVDVVVCALDPHPEAALDLLRDVRASGDDTRFVLLASRSDPKLRERARLLGRADWIDLDRLEEDGLVRRFARQIGSRPARPREVPVRNADFAPAMLWRTDGEGAFTHFTLEWCRFRGRSEEDEKGTGWEVGIHPEDLTRWRETFRKALEAREPFELDLRLRGADGPFCWVRHRGQPRFRDAALIGFLGSTFLIEDLVTEIAQLREQVERLGRKERELEEFAHAVGHELEQPLHTVEHALRVITEDLDPDDEPERRESWVQHARGSAQRMRLVLRDLIRLAVAGQGGTLERVALDEPLDWALSNLAPVIEQSGADVIRGPLPPAYCEPTQIAQVFQNLIGNAIKFRRREPLRIEIGADLAEEWLEIWVRDNGRGIQAEDQRVIFEAFQRRGGGDAAGSGLGLALCRRIVERHGGRISVRSTLDSGAEFRFSLPAMDARRARPRVGVSDASAAPDARRGSPSGAARPPSPEV